MSQPTKEAKENRKGSVVYFFMKIQQAAIFQKLYQISYDYFLS